MNRRFGFDEGVSSMNDLATNDSSISQSLPGTNSGNVDSAGRYRPYAVDWRFLPEPLLFAKDILRHFLVKTGNAAAIWPLTNRVWAVTFGQRTLNSLRKSSILFIHIPKTAGTSICYCLYGRNLPHYTLAFYQAAFGDHIKGFPSFSILRDPVERLRSNYRFLKTGGTDIIATSRFDTKRLNAAGSFDAFVASIEDNPRLLDDVVFLRPQAQFVTNTAGVVEVDRLYAIDGDGKLPQSLTDWLGLDQIPRLNSSHVAIEPLTDIMRDKIRQIYHEDCILYDRVMSSPDKCMMRFDT